MSSQSIIGNITHLNTQSGMPLAMTVSTYRLVAALMNMPCVKVPGKEDSVGEQSVDGDCCTALASLWGITPRDL